MSFAARTDVGWAVVSLLIYCPRRSSQCYWGIIATLHDQAKLYSRASITFMWILTRKWFMVRIICTMDTAGRCLRIFTNIFTARVRSTRECTVFTGVCLLIFRGGTPSSWWGVPLPRSRGDNPSSWLGVPHLRSRQGVPHLAGDVLGPGGGSGVPHPAGGGTPSQVQGA